MAVRSLVSENQGSNIHPRNTSLFDKQITQFSYELVLLRYFQKRLGRPIMAERMWPNGISKHRGLNQDKGGRHTHLASPRTLII